LERLQAGLKVAVETADQTLEIWATAREAVLHGADRAIATRLAEEALRDGRALVLNATNAGQRASAAGACDPTGARATRAGDATRAAAAARACSRTRTCGVRAARNHLVRDVRRKSERTAVLVYGVLAGVRRVTIQACAPDLVATGDDLGAALCLLTI
jgi:Tfp pilus assembly protein PilX